MLQRLILLQGNISRYAGRLAQLVQITPITMDLPLGDPGANNLELAMYDCGNHPQYGIATFSVDFNEAEPPAEDPTPSTGDIFGVVVTLMAVSGTALVCMKKR